MQELPGADWQKGYEAGHKLRARIIYIDPLGKRVCLSLLPHLVSLSCPLVLPAINTVFEVSLKGLGFRVIPRVLTGF